MSEFKRVRSKYKSKSKLGGEFRGYSHYLLTVNLKRQSEPRLLEYCRMLAAYLKHNPSEVLDAEDWNKIENIETSGTEPENSGKTNELHFHLFIKIRHQTKVSINVPRAKLICQTLDPDVVGLNPWVRFKLMANSEDLIAWYAEKNK